MNFRRVGETGLLVEVDEPALHLATALAERDLPGVSDVVPAERTLLLRFDPRRTDAGTLEATVRATTTAAVDLSDETVTLDVVYDGEDLAEAAALAGLDVPALVAAHAAATWRVMFSGFAPGFGYLRCDDRRLDVPRRDTARTRVPAGSVALAAGYSGVYPTASPGGWQLIGRTDARLWDLDRDPPALLRPGVRVRFRMV
ncbi:allophanate hydrolase subunit 1 [Spongisporangium articulatum]|uniref:Allophanate hydrolase subunit 1 n=1 Tax=Spongisporangium articulatum TaxID=3362603 RepID=A0ABW8AIY1_9ACTN